LICEVLNEGLSRRLLNKYAEEGGGGQFNSEVEMKALNFIASSLARIKANSKQLVAPSTDLSRSELEFQIELRARLLKDIELVGSRLSDSNGAGLRRRVNSRYSDRRRLGHLILHRTKLTSAMASSPDRKVKIALRFQSVNPTELP
jgi:hypothetical protein